MLGFLSTQHTHLGRWGEGHNPEDGAEFQGVLEGAVAVAGDAFNRGHADTGFDAQAE
jgi:hypothetical protein